MTAQTFRDLPVWQDGMDLVEDVYRLTQFFPSYEAQCLTLLMRRAALVVPCSIAEGYTQGTNKEYAGYVSTAQLALAELRTQIEIAARLKYIPRDRVASAIEQTVLLSKHLATLRTSLNKRTKANEPPSSP